MLKGLVVSLVILAAGGEAQQCDLALSSDVDADILVRTNQGTYLQSFRNDCLIRGSVAGDIVRLLRGSKKCPVAWAITCLDHFNCKDILSDASTSLKVGLASLGFQDVITVRASECLHAVPDCTSRQHLVLNANLINASWANVLPRTAILVNLEQLISGSRLSAITAARIAMSDLRGSEPVVAAGKVAKQAAVRLPSMAKVLGVTVDDYRGFVTLDPVSANYPWFEYSYKNADLAREAGRNCVFVKPVGVSSRPVKRTRTFQGDVDFVHIGGISVIRRARVLAVLENAGWRAAVVEGCFHQIRDKLLGRANVGFNIHRHKRRRIAEVARLLTYAAHGMVIVSERGGDTLLESELQTAVFFASYSQLSSCAASLLQPTSHALNSTERLKTNVARLIQARQESQLLGTSLATLFPYCGFHGF